VSAYRVAIDQTIYTINSRAKYFRNLVVAVVSVSLGSIMWALVTWALSPLVACFLLLPICGLFFFLDSRLLNDWRSQLLEGWARGEPDFQSFRAAVDAIPTLPKDTLQSMLATLPSAGDLITEQRLSPGTRDAIATVVTAIHACHSDTLALKVVCYAVVGSSFIAAVVLRMWQPLSGIAIITLFPLLQKRLRRWRLRRSKERTLAAPQQPDFDCKKFAELVACLPWEPIPAAEKDAFLANWSARQRSTPASSRSSGAYEP
jgi:hypothetical protein